MNNYLVFMVVLIVFAGCSETNTTLFTRLSESDTGITFRNLLKEDNPDFNILSYPYFYNGGGVAIGDLNNDGLPDIFFTGNMVKNRLFINQGDMEFEDVTTTSHVADQEGWCTGATMIDINQDGWLDIYVCRSGLSNTSYRKNLLFINNHDLTFTEQAAQYGLDDAGYSTQASFFDYDRDSDLDMILINQSLPEYSRGQVDYVTLKNQVLDSVYRNKLFRNDGGKFIDVSTQAGIRSNVLTFSLGVSTADLNVDGWPDIYIANDFKEPDHYYVNNGDGTFSESIRSATGHNSLYAMGVDAADYNNDMLPDVVVLDMLAEGNEAQKMHMGADNYTQYKYLFGQGMHPQFMKNTLQKNNGDGTFSEIGQLAGISNTDWSWSPLFADFDNDGLKDLFVSNGYKRDNTDIEFVVYSMNESIRIQKGGEAVNVADYVSHMPGIHLPNYIYKNIGNDRFESKVKAWGFDHATFSHGAAYADLDNDGDLDIVTNNTDEYAGVYRNNSDQTKTNHFIKIKLAAERGFDFGIGAKVCLYAGGLKLYLEQNPVRGYQSSVDHVLHAGLGDKTTIDSIRIVWPDASTQLLKNIPTDQTITISRKDAAGEFKSFGVKKLFIPSSVIGYTHQENDHNDFLKQFLLPHDYSHQGPCLAKGDINQDGIEDLFVGGARGQACTIFRQSKDGTFTKMNTSVFGENLSAEANGAKFFDADGDLDQDLFVVYGGYSQQNPDKFFGILYKNNGLGVFTATEKLQSGKNAKAIAVQDIDADGDNDLFVGGHVKSGNFPLSDESVLLLNDGKGKFTPADLTAINNGGIVNDAAWSDVNGDGVKDLIVAAEWMPLQVYLNKGGKLFQDTTLFLQAGKGLWYSLLVHDFDRDGDEDVVAGNYGLNSQFKADKTHPLQAYYADFDENGSIDPIITHYIGEQAYPLIPRDDLNGQMPGMKKKFNDYKAYSTATIQQILKPEQLQRASKNVVNNLETIYMENTGNGFVPKTLPIEVQYAPLNALVAGDFNHDGFQDIIAAGNLSYNRIYLGKHDANYGALLLGDGHGNFRYEPQFRSGLNLSGDVKHALDFGNGVLFAINGSALAYYRY